MWCRECVPRTLDINPTQPVQGGRDAERQDGRRCIQILSAPGVEDERNFGDGLAESVGERWCRGVAGWGFGDIKELKP